MAEEQRSHESRNGEARGSSLFSFLLDSSSLCLPFHKHQLAAIEALIKLRIRAAPYRFQRRAASLLPGATTSGRCSRRLHLSAVVYIGATRSWLINEILEIIHSVLYLHIIHLNRLLVKQRHTNYKSFYPRTIFQMIPLPEHVNAKFLTLLPPDHPANNPRF